MDRMKLAGDIRAISDALHHAISTNDNEMRQAFEELRQITLSLWLEEGGLVSDYHRETDLLQNSFHSWLRGTHAALRVARPDLLMIRQEMTSWMYRLADYTKTHLQYVFDDGLLGELVRRTPIVSEWETGEEQTDEPIACETEVETVAYTETASTMNRLLAAYTKNLSNDKLKSMAAILNDSAKNSNEKITSLHEMLPLNGMSSNDIAKLIGVRKQAVQKSDYWKNNRYGKHDEESESRREVLRKRGKRFEENSSGDEFD